MFVVDDYPSAAAAARSMRTPVGSGRGGPLIVEVYAENKCVIFVLIIIALVVR